MTRQTRLWAGWRRRYVESLDRETSSGPSVFTELLRSGRSDDETLVVHRGRETFVVLNLHPYSIGHLLVLPYREVPEPADLTSSESRELWATVNEAVAVLREEYRPDGVNVGLNLGRAAGGSVAGHLHVHVVPRWFGDANFMAATADTRVLPESLPVTADRIRTTWSRRPTT